MHTHTHTLTRLLSYNGGTAQRQPITRTGRRQRSLFSPTFLLLQRSNHAQEKRQKKIGSKMNVLT